MRLRQGDATQRGGWGRAAVSVGKCSLLEIDGLPCDAVPQDLKLAEWLLFVEGQAFCLVGF